MTSPATVAVDPVRVRSYRLRAGHLDARLPVGSEREAAWGGLQDTAPRSALLELHARMAGVGPGGWESPRLAQIWFRRASYAIPRDDFATFTTGASPRDPEQAAALDALADELLRVLDGRWLNYRDLAALGFDSKPIRTLGCTGKVFIRWDARDTLVGPAESTQAGPGADPRVDRRAARLADREAARLELARRFLRWHGPATERQFAKWSGVALCDATATFESLAGELVRISVDGDLRWLRGVDLAELRNADPVTGVRLLAPDDPYLYLDADLVGDCPQLGHVDRDAVGRRLINSLSGRILVDGEIVGSWGRVQGRFSLAAWRDIEAGVRARVQDEIESMAQPLGRPVEVVWLS